MARRVLMAVISGGQVLGRPRMGWIDIGKVAFSSRRLPVEAARQ